jgi:hypothetical protein
MSSNELNFDKSNQMLQAERNCINFDGTKRFNVNYKAMSHDDACFIDISTRQSIGPGNYAVFSPYDCECMIPETVKQSTDNVCVPFKNGYGTEQPCVVDDGSKLRWGLTKKFPKCPQQLSERPYKTVAYMGRGYLRPDEESELKFAEDTRIKKSCNTLSGVTIPHQYTPLLDHLSYNVQNPTHIIQEYNSPSWRRGGIISRNLIKDVDMLQRCGANYQYAYMNKTTNADFWQNKSQLLQNQ